jgi:hypothetical protein
VDVEKPSHLTTGLHEGTGYCPRTLSVTCFLPCDCYKNEDHRDQATPSKEIADDCADPRSTVELKCRHDFLATESLSGKKATNIASNHSVRHTDPTAGTSGEFHLCQKRTLRNCDAIFHRRNDRTYTVAKAANPSAAAERTVNCAATRRSQCSSRQVALVKQ